MLNREDFVAKWSVLHSDAPVKGLTAAWLKISYRFGLIATILRISPTVLTLLGLASAAMTALTASSWWAIIFLIFSLFCDAIDGSVAIFQKRENAWGSTLDSVVDRISEAFWLYALYVIGVPAWLAVTIWSIVAFQEYSRAKLSSLNIREYGPATPTDRPLRGAFLFVTLLMWQLDIPFITFIALGFLMFQVVSFILVVRFAHSQLR